MKFFKQKSTNECQIIALKTALSHFDIYPTTKELRSKLPKHSFGNTIEELSEVLKTYGINSKIYKSEQFNPDLIKTVAILNVDWNKIAGRKGNKIIPHYVAVLKEDQSIWLCDGSNQENPVLTNVDLLSRSLLNKTFSLLTLSI